MTAQAPRQVRELRPRGGQTGDQDDVRARTLDLDGEAPGLEGLGRLAGGPGSMTAKAIAKIHLNMAASST